MAQHRADPSSVSPPARPPATSTDLLEQTTRPRPGHRRNHGVLLRAVRRLLHSRSGRATRIEPGTPLTRSGATKVVLTLAAVVVFLCLAGAAPADALGAPVMAVKTLPQVIDSATAWIVGILATLGVFFFTLGGLRYMWAGGDPAEIEKAKGAFKGAALGFALAVLAPALMNIVKQIVGA